MTAEKIRQNYETAQKEAARNVAELFPVGCVVSVQGNKGLWIMRVTHHGGEWSDPLVVYGINTATGKNRRFYVGHDDVVILRQPTNKMAARRIEAGKEGA